MKKIVVLTILVLLAAMPLLASDVTFGGDVTWGFSYNEDDGYAPSTAATVDVMAAVDDFNAARVSLTAGAGPATLEEAHITHNLGAALGLADMGIGTSLRVGYFTAESQFFGRVTPLEREGLGVAAAKKWGYSLTLTLMDAINIKLAQGIEPAASDFLAGVYGAFGALSAELFYGLEGAAVGDGSVLFTAGYSLAPMAGSTLELGANFKYNLGAESYNYGIGTHFIYSMFNVGASFTGNDVNAADNLDFSVLVSPLDNLGVYASFGLDLEDGAAQTLNAIDLGLNLKVGLANAYFGYVISDYTFADAAIRKYNAPVAQSGLYAKFDINY